MSNRIDKHAPEWLRELEEYIQIWNMYPALDDAEAQIEYNNNQFFLDTAGVEGITRWESALGLPHTGTLDERRQNVLFLLQAKIPYTMRWLQNYLRIQWNDPKPHVVVHLNGDYILTIQPKDNILKEKFEAILRRKIPANIAIEWLPAPIGIYDYYSGQGVYDAENVELLSSGIYIPDLILETYYGGGLYIAEQSLFDIGDDGENPLQDYIQFNTALKYNESEAGSSLGKPQLRDKRMSTFEIDLVDESLNHVAGVLPVVLLHNWQGVGSIGNYNQLSRIAVKKSDIVLNTVYFIRCRSFSAAYAYVKVIFKQNSDGIYQMEVYIEPGMNMNIFGANLYGALDMDGDGNITDNDIDILNGLYNTGTLIPYDQPLTEQDFCGIIAWGPSYPEGAIIEGKRQIPWPVPSTGNQTYVADYQNYKNNIIRNAELRVTYNEVK